MKKWAAGLVFVLIVIQGCIESTSPGSELYHKNGPECYFCHSIGGEEFDSGVYEPNSAAGTVFIDSIGSSALESAVIKAISQSTLIETTTDDLGNFVITELDPGESYYFTVTYGNRSSSSIGTGMELQSTGGDYISCNRSGCHDSIRRIYP